jgi:pyruvate/2-oxoglutarate/acetoin dehydrogenase E1 component
VRADVPDEAYEVTIGEGKIVREGSDITIVGYGPAVIEINEAAAELESSGISAEVVDPRSIKPMPVDMIVGSARKTGRLLAVDHGHETLSAASEVIARTALAAPGTRFGRLTFPDAPPPGSRVMISWMTPDAAKVVEAAKKLVAA